MEFVGHAACTDENLNPYILLAIWNLNATWNTGNNNYQ